MSGTLFFILLTFLKQHRNSLDLTVSECVDDETFDCDTLSVTGENKPGADTVLGADTADKTSTSKDNDVEFIQ